MPIHGKDIPRFTFWLAASIGLILAVAPPAAYLAVSWQSLRVSLESETEINARRVTEFAAMNPLLWQFDETRLKPLLQGDEVRAIPECRSVYDAQGVVVAVDHGGGTMGHAGELPWPVVVRSSPVWDAGTVAGRVEIRRSLRPMLQVAAVVGASSLLLSAAALTMFLLYPMARLRAALSDLWETKERAQVTLQSIADGVIATDMEGSILLMNHAAESITGWVGEKAVGKPLREVFPLCEGDGTLPRDATSTAQGVRTLVTPLGEERSIESCDSPILDRMGKPIGSVLVLRDVTEKVRMEAELFQGRKLESLGVLAGGIAHDFNNLLTGILGNISLAKEMIDPGKWAYKRLDEAESASLRAKDLATRLLAFSKGGKPIRREISLERVARDAVGLTLVGTPVRCEFRVLEGVWASRADADQIGQVFHNLVLNAVQASPEGGTIRISMENVLLREGEVQDVPPGKYVKVDVIDEGTGIPQEILGKIFDPYFSTKGTGSGLGLATCYAILKNHGGNILVDSTPGTGTTIRLYLPGTGEVPLQEPLPPPQYAPMPGTARVLLMDDEGAVRDVAGAMLAHLGYRAEFARNGEEAIAMFAEAARGPEPFDLVIMDLTIPGGMGGKEAASRILAEHPQARLVVSSGYSDNPVMANHEEYGFVGVIAKPYKVAQLSHVLREVLGRSDPVVPPSDPGRPEVISPSA